MALNAVVRAHFLRQSESQIPIVQPPDGRQPADRVSLLQQRSPHGLREAVPLENRGGTEIFACNLVARFEMNNLSRHAGRCDARHLSHCPRLQFHSRPATDSRRAQYRHTADSAFD
jgi:hypothetical protein